MRMKENILPNRQGSYEDSFQRKMLFNMEYYKYIIITLLVELQERKQTKHT